jgi:hypothetical protein
MVRGVHEVGGGVDEFYYAAVGEADGAVWVGGAVPNWFIARERGRSARRRRGRVIRVRVCYNV